MKFNEIINESNALGVSVKIKKEDLSDMENYLFQFLLTLRMGGNGDDKGVIPMSFKNDTAVYFKISDNYGVDFKIPLIRIRNVELSTQKIDGDLYVRLWRD